MESCPSCYALKLGLRYWNSNYIRTPQSAAQTAPTSQGSLATLYFKPTFHNGGAMLHGALNRLFFTPKISNTGPSTGDGFYPESSAGPSYARRMEGGVAGLR